MSEIIKAAIIVLLIILIYKIYTNRTSQENYYPYILNQPRYCNKLRNNLSKFVNNKPIPQSGIMNQSDADEVTMNAECSVYNSDKIKHSKK